MKNPIVLLASLIGILLFITAGYYFLTPASALPTFFPGYEAGSNSIHYKHGLGAAILGLGAFALAWFQSGPKST